MNDNNKLDEVTLSYGKGQLHLKKNFNVFGLRRKNRALIIQPSSMTPYSLTPFRTFDLYLSNDTENTLDELRNHKNVLVGTHVYYASNEDIPIIPTGLLYAEFKEGVQKFSVAELISEYKLQFVESRGNRKYILRTTRYSPNPLKVANALQRHPAVEIAEPDIATLGIMHSDPFTSWHLKNSGHADGFEKGADSRLLEAQAEAQSQGSSEVIVAVIDQGFDFDHPVFAGPNKIIAPKDFADGDLYPSFNLPTENHGTACASIAVGNYDDEKGFMGVAPKSRLMPIRFHNGYDFNFFGLEQCFQHALSNGAWVVNCSWAAADSTISVPTLVYDAIHKCAIEGRNGLGTVVCFSIGNDGMDISSLNGFANHQDVWAIGAFTSEDKRSSYANFGSPLLLCAPSDGLGGWPINAAKNGGKYTDFDGTSAACAVFAGICAFLLSLKPNLKVREFKEILIDTARKIDPALHTADGHSLIYGYGYIDALRAVKAIMRLP
ncbi:S8 family serine peptidase [Flavilitoribacter nigricans]|uniref:Peptidase S8/S53 domain-containing protein n=1 Tax=Flavilitoribacter nigricans (strain ATCC 23147 / DSM 23189 / NBRC 102662 / NCIMB 1420 / SS-2) TaxID=1122177 RepID=A0A2D0MXT6_FLAN2|nr:S8 family serine peptidase [Flavilitoribacter nigricans]PHN00936.1 hypothetical protein CRP01_39770 [Flavilitoribacter nigricans DSM 23189 = NBRC 102662]